MKLNIETYALRVCGGPDGLRSPLGVRAQIRLYSDTGETRTLSFYEEPHAPPPESEGSHMTLPMSAFASTVDMLRNEKPIHLIWKPGVGYFLQTEHELVGEGDLKHLMGGEPHDSR